MELGEGRPFSEAMDEFRPALSDLFNGLQSALAIQSPRASLTLTTNELQTNDLHRDDRVVGFGRCIRMKHDGSVCIRIG